MLRNFVRKILNLGFFIRIEFQQINLLVFVRIPRGTKELIIKVSFKVYFLIFTCLVDPKFKNGMTLVPSIVVDLEFYLKES